MTDLFAVAGLIGVAPSQRCRGDAIRGRVHFLQDAENSVFVDLGTVRLQYIDFDLEALVKTSLSALASREYEITVCDFQWRAVSKTNSKRFSAIAQIRVSRTNGHGAKENAQSAMEKGAAVNRLLAWLRKERNK